MLPKKSENVYASTPSVEFPYTWVDFKNGTYGLFFSTEDEARSNARLKSTADLAIVQVKDFVSHDDADEVFERILARKEAKKNAAPVMGISCFDEEATNDDRPESDDEPALKVGFGWQNPKEPIISNWYNEFDATDTSYHHRIISYINFISLQNMDYETLIRVNAMLYLSLNYGKLSKDLELALIKVHDRADELLVHPRQLFNETIKVALFTRYITPEKHRDISDIEQSLCNYRLLNRNYG